MARRSDPERPDAREPKKARAMLYRRLHHHRENLRRKVTHVRALRSSRDKRVSRFVPDHGRGRSDNSQAETADCDCDKRRDRQFHRRNRD